MTDRRQNATKEGVPSEHGAAMRCPVRAGYDPLSPDELRDPFPSWAAAREETPVFFMPDQNVWALMRWADCVDALKDIKRFVNENVHQTAPPPQELVEEFPNGYPWQEFNLLATDGDLHTKVRRLVNIPFRRSRVVAYEPRIAELTEKLIDGFVDRGRCDLMEDFAYALPMQVIMSILGVPEGGPEFRQWTEDALVLGAPDLDHDERVLRSERIIELRDRCQRLVEERRAEPRNDMITDLVNAELEDGSVLTDLQITGLIIEFIHAGNDTTGNLIAHTLMLLLEHPEQWEAVKREPETLIPEALEETLRYRGSARGMFRRTAEEVEMGGATIPEGAFVQVMFSAADRDPEEFDRPDEYDIFRDKKEHLGFGRGTHFCVGAFLARLEAKIALEAIIERMPDIRAVPGQKLQYSRSLIQHVLEGFEVEWTPPRSAD